MRTDAFLRGIIHLLLLLCVCLVPVGCGGPVKYRTRGRVLKSGEPFRPPPADAVHVTFLPVPEPGQRIMNEYAASYNGEDGTFRAEGPDGKGIPPGKYRICIEQLRERADVLAGAYCGEHSPFVREIWSAADEVTIDLDRKD